ncbi:hypothetical protein V495_04416, partial [Pseudogymnoascus sp. VKM F-4514 (FW-929)]
TESAQPFVSQNKDNLAKMEIGQIHASPLGKIEEYQEPEDAARGRRSGALSKIQHTSSPTDKGT